MPLIKLAGIVLIPFVAPCRAVLFEKWQQKSGCVFQLRRTQPPKSYPAGRVILILNIWKEAVLFGMVSEFFYRGCASMKNGSLEFFIQNSRSPHTHWLYGPCIYIGQMFWCERRDLTRGAAFITAPTSSPFPKLIKQQHGFTCRAVLFCVIRSK